MTILNEAGLHNIYKKTQNYATGAFTAFRGDKTKKENKANNKKALAFLLDRGYSVMKVKGSYVEQYGTEKAEEVGEESFFVANNAVEGDDGGQLEADLVKLGKAFDQDSILSVPFGKTGRLVGTSGRDEAFPGLGEIDVVGYPQFGDTDGQFFSRSQGRVFSFKEAVEINLPQTNNGRWAMSKASEAVQERIDATEEVERLKKLSGIG